MKGGSVVLTPLPQADGQVKNRPALVLGAMRPFGDLLVCGISTQVRLVVPDFDEVMDPSDADFALSGLAAPSVIRLGFLSTVPLAHIKGRIGAIDAARYRRMVDRLTNYFSGLAPS